MEQWTEVDDGYADGPSLVVEESGRKVVVSAVWTDEDGVCVSVEAGDEPVPAGLAVKVWAEVLRLSKLSAPVLGVSALFAGDLGLAFSAL